MGGKNFAAKPEFRVRRQIYYECGGCPIDIYKVAACFFDKKQFYSRLSFFIILFIPDDFGSTGFLFHCS